MTPFEKAGYTEKTKFKVLRGDGGIRDGDIVTLQKDDNSTCPYFENQRGRIMAMYLPDKTAGGIQELEVYEEPTITRDTKLSVEMTVEEAIAARVVLGHIPGLSRHKELTSKVYWVLSDALLEVGCNLVSGLLSIPDISVEPEEGCSLKDLIDAMVPSSKKQKALAEAKELRTRLEALEKDIEGMEG